MIRPGIALLALLPLFASAAENDVKVVITPSPGVDLYRSTTKTGTLPSTAECEAENIRDAKRRGPGVYSYGCQALRHKMTITVTSTPVSVTSAADNELGGGVSINEPAGVTWTRATGDRGTFTCFTECLVRIGVEHKPWYPLPEKGAWYYSKHAAGSGIFCFSPWHGSPWEAVQINAADIRCDVSPASALVKPVAAKPAPQLPSAFMPGTPVVDASKLMEPVLGWGGNNRKPASNPPPPPDPTTTVGGSFRLSYVPSHMNWDDPIVYPRKCGATPHLHVFWGGAGTDCNTDMTKISECTSSTSWGGILNCSRYWMPAIVKPDGTPVVPSVIWLYYKEGSLQPRYVTIVEMPVGLRMIAGMKMDSTSLDVEKAGVTNFSCVDAGAGGGARSLIIPKCVPGQTLQASVSFPRCWDGVNLDSPDHRSHMSHPEAYQTDPTTNAYGFRCPTTHPKAIPEIVEIVFYPVGPGDDTSTWRLSSDMFADCRGCSLHGDFINGWKPAIQRIWVTKCLIEHRDCGQGPLGDNTQLYGNEWDQ